jgi:hypothetical protein
LSEPSESRLELIAAEPVPALTAAVAHLDRAVRAVDDEATDAVDLRLAGEAVRVGDRLAQGALTVVRDEMRDDGLPRVPF